jgi:hypothetical protein
VTEEDVTQSVKTCQARDTVKLSAWNSTLSTPSGRQEIDLFLQYIKELKEKYMSAHVCEVRFTSFLPPYSAVLAEPTKDDAWMILALHGYKAVGDERPHLPPARRSEPGWFTYFYDESELMWLNAKVWIPS